MAKEKIVDYFQAMQEYDKSLGRKTDDFDAQLQGASVEDGGVDYTVLTREFEKYLIEDQSEVIRIRK